MFSAGVDIDFMTLRRGPVSGARVDRAVANPAFKVGDHRRWQLPLGRHLKTVVAKCRDDQAFVHVARYDGRARIASLKQRGTGINAQPTFGAL